jgi:hypothetical protein
MLSSGGRMAFQGPPDDMSTSAPFIAEGFTTPPSFLPGIKVAPAVGVKSGSTLFPFPLNIPADALTPQGASLVGSQPQPDGGAVDYQSFSTFDPGISVPDSYEPDYPDSDSVAGDIGNNQN